MLQGLDVSSIRRVLFSDISPSAIHSFTDVRLWLPSAENKKGKHIATLVEPVLTYGRRSTVLLRRVDQYLEWSVAVAGATVGAIYVQAAPGFLSSDIREEGGIRLTFTKDRMIPELIDPLRYKPPGEAISSVIKTAV
jgi:hypothetical protein